MEQDNVALLVKLACHFWRIWRRHTLIFPELYVSVHASFWNPRARQAPWLTLRVKHQWFQVCRKLENFSASDWPTTPRLGGDRTRSLTGAVPRCVPRFYR